MGEGQRSNDQTGEDRSMSRRRFSRGVLLGTPAAMALIAGAPDEAQAAGGKSKWLLGGNGDIAPEGANFLGPTNGEALVFKTADVAGNPVERLRITPAGLVGVGTSAPAAPLHVDGGPATAVVAEVSDGARSAMIGTHGAAGTGVEGSAPKGFGVHGTGWFGVVGQGAAPEDTGVYGESSTGNGVTGSTNVGYGVYGASLYSSGSAGGVYGYGAASSNFGVLGEASGGPAAFGVWGVSGGGYAGAFSGNVIVTGTLSKAAGSFQIDHPQDPANRYLYHSFVESPDMMNVYNGNVVTDSAGRATVELPSYFESLNSDFRYQLTVIGAMAQAIVESEVSDNRFVVRTDRPAVKVSWQITGIRRDAFANTHRIPTEVDKPAHERGTYLHPEAHGLAAADGFLYARLAEIAGHRSANPLPRRAAP